MANGNDGISSRIEPSEEFNKLLFAVGSDTPIFDDCYSISVVKICARITLTKCVVKIYIAGEKLIEGCVDWKQEQNNINSAELTLPTLNIGLYKLSQPKFHFEHDITSNDGSCKFNSVLYKLKGWPLQYRQIESWKDTVIFRW